MKFSEAFSLNKVQAELDFVDIEVDGDSDKEACAALAAGLALHPDFTISRLRATALSDISRDCTSQEFPKNDQDRLDQTILAHDGGSFPGFA